MFGIAKFPVQQFPTYKQSYAKFSASSNVIRSLFLLSSMFTSCLYTLPFCFILSIRVVSFRGCFSAVSCLALPSSHCNNFQLTTNRLVFQWAPILLLFSWYFLLTYEQTSLSVLSGLTLALSSMRRFVDNCSYQISLTSLTSCT